MDDQQARDQMIEGLKVAMLGTTDGDFIDPNSDIPAGEMFRLAAEYLAALPVAPEQPTQANDVGNAWRQWYSEEKGELWGGEGYQRLSWESFKAGAAVVSSPSVETVTQNAASVNAGVVLAALDALLEDWTLHPRAEASAMKLGVQKLRDHVAQQSVTPDRETIASEERREWADYIEGWGSHVGDPEFTQARIVELMRGPRPFGAADGREHFGVSS